MVDVYGRWTYEPDTPEEKKCDCDRIADWVREKGYKPETTIENLVLLVMTITRPQMKKKSGVLRISSRRNCSDLKSSLHPLLPFLFRNFSLPLPASRKKSEPLSLSTIPLTENLNTKISAFMVTTQREPETLFSA